MASNDEKRYAYACECPELRAEVDRLQAIVGKLQAVTGKTAKDIIESYLSAHGYDGLVADDCECGCEVGELILCDGPFDTCCPGHRGPDPEGECDWLIYHTPEAAEAAKENEDGEQGGAQRV